MLQQPENVATGSNSLCKHAKPLNNTTIPLQFEAVYPANLFIIIRPNLYSSQSNSNVE